MRIRTQFEKSILLWVKKKDNQIMHDFRKQLVLICGKDGSDLILEKGKYSLIYRCKKYFFENRNNGEKSCRNYISLKDRERLIARLSIYEEENELKVGVKDKVGSIRYEIIKVTDDVIEVKVLNVRMCGEGDNDMYQMTFSQYDELLEKFEKMKNEGNVGVVWPTLEQIDTFYENPKKWMLFVCYLYEMNPHPSNQEEKYSRANMSAFINKNLELVDDEEN